MKLINDWRKAWKFWSLQLGIAGTVITSVFLAIPEAALYAWSVLPHEIKQLLSPEIIKWIGIAILVSSFLARVVKQSKLEAELNERRINATDKDSSGENTE